MTKINKAVMKWIFANCRPYEVANDVLFPEMLEAAGAKYGNQGKLCKETDISTVLFRPRTLGVEFRG